MTKVTTAKAADVATVAVKPKGRFASKIARKQAITGILFLLPTAIFFILFWLIPFGMGLFLAFCDFNLVNDPTLVGLLHFEWIFQNQIFLHSILNILIYVLFFVPQTVIFSLLVANFLNKKMKGIKAFRAIYYLPAITSGVAVAFVWKFMFNESYGLFNNILGTNLQWVNSSNYFAMFCISMVTVWTSIGGNMLVYLAGLQGIPRDYYEAAEIDGANGFQRLMKITIPLLMPTTYFILTMSLIGAFQLYDVVAMMGGVNYYTQTPVTMIYGQFSKFEGGRASAQSFILFVVIMVVTFITQFITKLMSRGEEV